jgi:UDP-glucose 4-epimerase
MNILVAGGLGYVGSHAALDLLKAGHDIFIIDNMCNSTAETKEKIERISGKSVRFSAADIRDETALNEIFRHNALDAVFHFAGLKAVGGDCPIKGVNLYERSRQRKA